MRRKLVGDYVVTDPVALPASDLGPLAALVPPALAFEGPLFRCVNLRRVSSKIWRKGTLIDSATLQMSPAANFRVVSAGMYSSEAGRYKHCGQRMLVDDLVREEGSQAMMALSLRAISIYSTSPSRVEQQPMTGRGISGYRWQSEAYDGRVQCSLNGVKSNEAWASRQR